MILCTINPKKIHKRWTSLKTVSGKFTKVTLVTLSKKKPLIDVIVPTISLTGGFLGAEVVSYNHRMAVVSIQTGIKNKKLRIALPISSMSLHDTSNVSKNKDPQPINKAQNTVKRKPPQDVVEKNPAGEDKK